MSHPTILLRRPARLPAPVVGAARDLDVTNHYRYLLAPIYLWSCGGHDRALAQGWAEAQALGDPPTELAVAVDLGAGFGKHAIPLARAGWQVTAIDSSAHLLDLLRRSAVDLPVRAIEGDLTDFRRLVDSDVALILCLGDTITHLPHSDQVWQLLRDVAQALVPGGRFVATLRDYSALPAGAARFITVRQDIDRIHTCFLAEAGDRVLVHDLVHERTNGEWVLQVSRYAKLRLRPEALRAALMALGLRVTLDTSADGLVRLIATKPA